LDVGLAADGFIVSALSGLVVARALFLLATLSEGPDLDPLALRQGGLFGIGAVLGCLLGAALFFRGRATSLWQWLDLNATNLCLGIVMLRIGCYLHGCDFGPRLGEQAPNWLRQLGTFPRWADPDQVPVHGSLAWVQQVQSGSLASERVFAHPVHPLQLYEVGFGVLLVLLAWYLGPRRSFHGQTALSVLFAYAVGCFVFEVVHGDLPRGALGPAVELRILLPFGLLLFAVAFTYGPALSMQRARRRYASILLSLLPAAVVAVVTWSNDTVVELMVGQWLALVLAGGASYVWSIRHQGELGRAPATVAEVRSRDDG
jgi:phosphatidylglycerol:prolipoprotein diacylglycerol transferase